MATCRKKKVAVPVPNGEQLLAPAVTFETLWPELTWHLQAITWGDGKTDREQGAISIFPQDGLWKAALRERNLGHVTFLTGRSVHDLLCRLEQALANHTVQWREDRYAQKSTKGG